MKNRLKSIKRRDLATRRGLYMVRYVAEKNIVFGSGTKVERKPKRREKRKEKRKKRAEEQKRNGVYEMTF